MIALILGTLLAIGALGYVLQPLLFASLDLPFPRLAKRKAVAEPDEDDAVVALREIEFDHATGKIAQGDYDELRARYTQRALEAMRRGTGADALAPDAVEAALAAYRARSKECVTCGPRPEPDAVFCSSCGHYLPGQCSACGSAVGEKGATYCSACGRSLAA